jgi:hypothetical protein
MSQTVFNTAQGTATNAPQLGAALNAMFGELYTGRVCVTDAPYSADPTGVIDSTAAIQAAINVAAALGGGVVLLPAGTYTIGTAGTGLVINTSNVKLVGAGSNFLRRAAFTATNPATQLIWGGASSATASMLLVATPAGSGFAQSGNGATGIEFNCNSLCGYGIQLVSQKTGSYEGSFVINPIKAAYLLTTLLNSSLPNDGTDTQHNIFTRCGYRCLDSAAAKKSHGFWFTSVDPIGQPGNGNSSFNTLVNCVGIGDGTTTNSSGVGYKFDGADNNTLFNCIAYRSAGSTVPSLQLSGYNGSCDGNVFLHYSDTTAANAINVLGNATLGSGFNPTQNCFIFSDSNNGVNYPTMDAGCRVYWTDTNGVSQKAIHTSVVIGQAANIAAALAQVANVANHSARIVNSSQDHTRLTDGTNEWGVNIDGSGNLRISRIAGTGNPTCIVPFISGAVGLPAGGSQQCGVGVSTTANLGLYFGTGAPSFSAAEGAIYSNTTGTSGARLYVNTSAGSGTTWTALTTP